ncbi:hypothetical protein HCCG_02061 [Helicobacter cinaedi CCUG 18818 = ATCC BAA-847]|uniref:Uncharacterized protein n=1 Tax=Helicobacter cinaedi CCUG 18818 = ATCC BAA-847 TaxID=537971 RepID=A0ABN0BCY6_9HELI|nr:hypothetical protein HCCG_02061 [Helicobacter cinaedi CCUG 18818 = ATCC BAA-847]
MGRFSPFLNFYMLEYCQCPSRSRTCFSPFLNFYMLEWESCESNNH